MPQRKAAKKDLRQNKKRRTRNLQRKQNIKSAVKKFKKSLETEDSAQQRKALNEVYKMLDKATGTNMIHKNTVARKKSQLAGLIKKPVKK